ASVPERAARRGQHPGDLTDRWPAFTLSAGCAGIASEAHVPDRSRFCAWRSRDAAPGHEWDAAIPLCFAGGRRSPPPGSSDLGAVKSEQIRARLDRETPNRIGAGQGAPAGAIQAGKSGRSTHDRGGGRGVPAALRLAEINALDDISSR